MPPEAYLTLPERKALKVRLMADGKWRRFRELQKRYEAGGATRGVSWQRARQDVYPSDPVPAAPEVAEEVPAAGPKEREPRVAQMAGRMVGPRPALSKGDLDEMYLWIFANLGASGLVEKDAPHPAWYELLRYYRTRRHRPEFYKDILPKLITQRAKVETDYKKGDDGREISATIDRVRKARENALSESGAEAV